MREEGKKYIKDVQAAEAKALAAKQAFEQARKKQDETKEEYERAAFTNQQSPAVEKLGKKMRADAKKSTTCDKKYKESVDACRSLQDKFYDEEMPRILAVSLTNSSCISDSLKHPTGVPSNGGIAFGATKVGLGRLCGAAKERLARHPLCM